MARSTTVLAIVLFLFGGTNGFADTTTSDTQAEGFTQPYQTVDLAASESGVIDQLFVREGDTVQAGDTIACLRYEVLQATRQATLAKLNSTGNRMAAAATLAHRENHLAQLRALYAESHASDQEVADAEFNVRLAEAQLQNADEQLEVLRAELNQIDAQIKRRRIVAPIDGVISELPIQAGERVGSGDESVAKLVRLDKLRVRLYLPTAMVTNLRVGGMQSLHFPDTDQSARSTIDFIAPTTDSSSGTVRVECLIDNAEGQYRAGVRCRLQRSEDHKTFATLLRLRIRSMPTETIAHRVEPQSLVIQP